MKIPVFVGFGDSKTRTGVYRFAFNGMEMDDETYGDGNAYDFGARIYDPRIARWMSLDPLQKKYPFISPYSFCANNPIVYVDYDGRDYRYSIEIITDKNGKSYANISINTTIHAYGKDACNAENQFQIKGAVIVDYQGKQYIANVTVNVNVVAHESKEMAEQAMVAGDNLMQVDNSLTNEQMGVINGEVLNNEPVTSDVQGVAVRGGKYANLRTTNPNTILHESMHLVGLIDRYLNIKLGDASLNIPDDEYQNTSMGGNETRTYASNDYKDLAKQILKESQGVLKKTNTGKLAGAGLHVGKIINSISKNLSGPSKSEKEGNK